MKVLITGATGLIGKQIVSLCLNKGFTVHYLTTSKSKLSTEDHYKGFYWNPIKREINEECFAGVSVIINLVGATISKRWTISYKKEILESRTQTAQLLFDTIKKNDYKITHFITASAIGIYPSSYTNYYDEANSEVSKSFLGHVVAEWENAIDEFKTLNVKVSKIRIGLVLADQGGALPEIVKPVKLGVGAAFGSGKQWQSWIHIKDVAAQFLFILEHQLEGIYNAVAPRPVTNFELTKIIAKVLKRPLVLPNIPKFTMKLFLGEMHILLFESQRVSSKKIEAKGFQFQFTNLKSAVEDLLL